jgi:uncharacterized membrane protein
MAGLLAGSGALHLLVPGPYRRIVPRPISHAGEIVGISGICELLCAALLLLPRTRRLGAWSTAALFVVVFPANVQMALNGGLRGAPFPAGSAVVAWLRLPLQVPLVAWALRLRGDVQVSS